MELNVEQIKKALEEMNMVGVNPTAIRKALSLINSQEQRINELTEENTEVKANWKKLRDSYDSNDKEWREAYDYSQSKWKKLYGKLELTLIAVMHSVDKWLDGAELEQDEVNRAATMREKTLQIVERLTEENERYKRYYLNHEYDKMEADVKADTVRKMQERLKMYFGTYVLGYKIPTTETLKAVDQIAKEMLEEGD